MAKQKLDNDMTEMEMGTAPENDKAYDALRAKHDRHEKASKVLKSAGYARGGKVHEDAAADKKLFKKEISKTKLEVKKHGGKVEGKHTKTRADKYARGGSVPKGHTKININMGASEADKQMATQKGMQMGAQMMAQKMAGGARPGAGAPMQARPAPQAPQAPGGMPQGGVNPTLASPQKRGGRTYAKGGKVGPVRLKSTPHLTGGAGGGKGRISKMAAYGSKPKA